MTDAHLGQPVQWDVFVSYASEDRDFVDILTRALTESGLQVWYDAVALRLGDSLSQSIDAGLLRSRFGVVVLSEHFFAKRWTRYELDGLLVRDLDRKVILPIWHGVDLDGVRRFSPTLAGRVAIRSSRPITELVDAVRSAILKPSQQGYRPAVLSQHQLVKPRLDLLRDLPVHTRAEEADE